MGHPSWTPAPRQRGCNRSRSDRRPPRRTPRRAPAAAPRVTTQTCHPLPPSTPRRTTAARQRQSPAGIAPRVDRDTGPDAAASTCEQTEGGSRSRARAWRVVSRVTPACRVGSERPWPRCADGPHRVVQPGDSRVADARTAAVRVATNRQTRSIVRDLPRAAVLVIPLLSRERRMPYHHFNVCAWAV